MPYSIFHDFYYYVYLYLLCLQGFIIELGGIVCQSLIKVLYHWEQACQSLLDWDFGYKSHHKFFNEVREKVKPSEGRAM